LICLLQHNHEELLSIQLDHSETTKDGRCPLFVPKLGVEALHQYTEQVKRDKKETG